MLLKCVADEFRKTGEFSEFLQRKDSKVSIEGIAPSSFALIIASIFNQEPRQTLVITKNYQKMQELYLDLTCFTDPQSVCLFPSWETMPYEYVSPSEKIEKERITSLYRIIKGESAIILAPLESLVRTIPERNFFIRKGFTLNSGEEYPFDDLIELLVSYGYTREYRVEAFGQFSVKGGIIDVYLPNHDFPLRLDFFGDTLEGIREFDPETQISTSQLKTVKIFPRKELILSISERKKLTALLEEAKSRGLAVPQDDADTEEMNPYYFRGIEDLYPLIIKPENILSFLRTDSWIFFLETGELINQLDQQQKMFQELYGRKSQTHLCVTPEMLFRSSTFDMAREQALELQVFTATVNALNWKIRGIPSFQGKIKNVRAEMISRIEAGWRVIVCTGFEGQARRLYDLLNEFSPGDDFETIDPERSLNISITSLREGFEIAELKIMVLTDHEIFGKTYRKKTQLRKKSSRPIESFLDLKVGDYVVHINHGIGVFRSIERMTAGGVARDFLHIEYNEGDKLYVPLDQITMVQRYIGLEGNPPRIDSLGKKSAWNKIREKVQKSVEELAKELIEIYARRRALKGFPYPPDTMWQEEFESKFEYEETPDQITAIEDVKDDMESTQPMDRLICGDVGFGKTEVAIRAAFKAVMAGKQVAVLIPTTILAMQHYNTFRRRFADYPINIDMVSRFRTRSQVADIKNRLAEGKLDIIIGTHALLAKDVLIKNLGLLIIDEEQRFGVKHKEQLKRIRTLVDVLTLSATPIPRTLHMSVAGIKDISIILTPPENRQSIETYVLEDNPDIVRMAILNEIGRGGQVFYVHNRVENIGIQARMISELVPEASFCIAHGQMHEHELEEVMIDFLNGKFDVLVSTTIIESGLDMPNVNTIIVNRADTFGLSQLYQLKGRVGRSITQAYAYLFYPRHIPLSETAQKRLQVISEYSELGSGFKIAMKDLEIRGSGNILGREQSGNIMDVGFDLYVQMLEDSVRSLKGERPVRMFRTPVFLMTDFYIPDTYIQDERQKIEFYKRFEACEEISEVEELQKEITDRFGAPPEEVRILIELEKVRAIASALEIEEILEDKKAIRIRISGGSKISVHRMVEMIRKDERLELDRGDKELLLFKPRENDNEKKIVELKKWLQQLN